MKKGIKGESKLINLIIYISHEINYNTKVAENLRKCTNVF